MKTIPIIGMLIVPKHKQQSFSTVLEVTLNSEDSSKFKVLYLRISDNKKIQSVWYPNSEVFWQYYEEK